MISVRFAIGWRHQNVIAAADIMVRSKRPATTVVTTYFPSPLPHTEQTIAFLAFFLFGCCFFARPVALDLAMVDWFWLVCGFWSWRSGSRVPGARK